MEFKHRFIGTTIMTLSLSLVCFWGIAGGAVKYDWNVEDLCDNPGSYSGEGQKLQIRINNHYWIWVSCPAPTIEL